MWTILLVLLSVAIMGAFYCCLWCTNLKYMSFLFDLHCYGDMKLSLIFGLMAFPLLDRVVWSGTLSLSFISWNIEVTKPSVCLRGRWKMSLRDNMVSMAWSEKNCCLPLFFDVRGFQDLMTEGDIQSVKEPRLHRDCSYSFQFVTLYFFLYFGLRLLLCSSFITSSIWMKNIIH